MTILNESLIKHPMNWIILFVMSILVMFVIQLGMRASGIPHPMPYGGNQPQTA
jgi:hypothetical protein